MKKLLKLPSDEDFFGLHMRYMEESAGFQVFHGALALTVGLAFLDAGASHIGAGIKDPAFTGQFVGLGGDAVLKVKKDGGVIDDGFESLAMLAFSPDDAPRAAQAIASDAFVVMVGHGDGAAATNG